MNDERARKLLAETWEHVGHDPGSMSRLIELADSALTGAPYEAPAQRIAELNAEVAGLRSVLAAFATLATGIIEQSVQRVGA